MIDSYKSHRLNFKDKYHLKEVIFYSYINKMVDSHPEILEQITGVENVIVNKHLSDREESLVVSTLQWLGTPVGQSFLEDCNDIFNKLTSNKIDEDTIKKLLNDVKKERTLKQRIEKMYNIYNDEI
jgi:hypothetical protein